MLKFRKARTDQPGFSLLEMILSVSLSGLIVVAVMALVIIFSNNYVASQRSGMKNRERICYENFLKLSLKDYRELSNTNREIDTHMLANGIFWLTEDLHAFKFPGYQFIAGIYFKDRNLYFLWTKSEEHSLHEDDFSCFKLFENIHSMRLVVYDREKNKWLKEDFNDDTVRKFLGKRALCYLRMKLENDSIFIPLFGI